MPGKSVQIYSTTSEIPILNWQRGLASIFLFRQENLEILETDVLGKCKTKYNLDRHGLHKFKEQCQSGYDLDDEVSNYLLQCDLPIHVFWDQEFSVNLKSVN